MSPDTISIMMGGQPAQMSIQLDSVRGSSPHSYVASWFLYWLYVCTALASYFLGPVPLEPHSYSSLERANTGS